MVILEAFGLAIIAWVAARLIQAVARKKLGVNRPVGIVVLLVVYLALYWTLLWIFLD